MSGIRAIGVPRIIVETFNILFHSVFGRMFVDDRTATAPAGEEENKSVRSAIRG
jgi:hypothetical protein